MPKKTYAELENYLFNEHSKLLKEADMISGADKLPVEKIILMARENGLTEQEIVTYLNAHAHPKEREFINLVNMGAIIRAENSNETATDVSLYQFNVNELLKYAIREMANNRGYLTDPTLSSTMDDWISDKLNIFFSIGGKKSTMLVENIKNASESVTNSLVSKIYENMLRRAILQKCDPEEEMENLNSVVAEIGDKDKMTRQQKAEKCGTVMKQLDFAIAGHKKRGFWSMVFHPIKFYRESKAISEAKNALVGLGMPREKVDEYASYLDRRTGALYDHPSGELSEGEDFSINKDNRMINTAKNAVNPDLTSPKELVGKEAWNSMTREQREVFEDRCLTASGRNSFLVQIDGAKLDKLVEKYYGIKPDHQNREEYGQKRLIIMHSYLRDAGIGGIPNFKIAEEDLISHYVDDKDDYVTNFDKVTKEDCSVLEALDAYDIKFDDMGREKKAQKDLTNLEHDVNTDHFMSDERESLEESLEADIGLDLDNSF